MSKIEVNTIDVATGCSITLGSSGKTITIPAGATITNSGTQTGFGRTGAVDWVTTPKTSGFTAENGKGYFCDTSSSAFTVTFPASPSAGNIIALADYTRTFDSNNLKIDAQSKKIGGVAQDATLNNRGQSVTFIFVDDTEGWINVQNAENAVKGVPPYIVATGGNSTITSGDFKTHIFTSPGTFSVTQEGNPTGSNGVEYMVVAGGGGGGTGCAGGSGGAGGMRLRTVCGSASPLNNPAPLQVSVNSFPIVVGAGGSGASSSGPGAPSLGGSSGADSVFSSITSAGGGGGAGGSPQSPATNAGKNGGAGGGGGHSNGNGGSGNTPPVSPPQGNDGAAGAPVNDDKAGGGGGAGAAASPTAPSNAPTSGGAGSYIPTTFIGPTAPSFGETGPQGRFFAGGGGGSIRTSPAGPVGIGGLGGGADGVTGPNPGSNASTNMGGGASGGVSGGPTVGGGNGGSGIVMIRYKFQN